MTSGSTPEAAEFVDSLYRSIITAGTHKASSIRVAEAAKVIENTQRDVNIALINELALIFNRLGIDTEEVLKAAGSKWNFLPFRPGLVGGHCIGVDPYYLTHKAQAIGYHPEMILAGRRINDNMGIYVAQQVAQLMIQRRIQVRDARILVWGSRSRRTAPTCATPGSSTSSRELHEVRRRRSTSTIRGSIAARGRARVRHADRSGGCGAGSYDAIVIGVAHQQFREMGIGKIRALGQEAPRALRHQVRVRGATRSTARL